MTYSLRWIWAFFFDCVHSHTTWPHENQSGHAYVCCLDCGRELQYSLEYMQIVPHSTFVFTDRNAGKASQHAMAQSSVSVVPRVARRILGGIILLGTIFGSQEKANAAHVPSTFNTHAQTACEAEMLGNMGAHEVFSGKAYNSLSEVAREYGRPTPHIYMLPEGWNMAYIAASIGVDGRGKIMVGQQATELFNNVALKGFLGHEVAHLVSDNKARGCNDYVVRDPQMEADADVLAARTLGRRPVEAFLERVLILTEGQNWDAKRRLAMLQEFQLTKGSAISKTSSLSLSSSLSLLPH